MMHRAMVAIMTAFGCAACTSPPPPAIPTPEAIATPAPNSLAAQVAGPWRHLPKPVSDQKFKQDKAKCAMTGEMAPVDAGSPEIKILIVFTECMRAEGYEPVQAPEGQAAAEPKPALPPPLQPQNCPGCEPYMDAADAAIRGDYGTTMRLMGPLAKQGDVNAQVMLGGAYFAGQNYTEAMKWYLRAADQGSAGAQSMLCGIYYSGSGVPQNYVQAMKWCRRAANQGDANSQFLLGASYYKGLSVPRNYVQAYLWFNLAAANPASKKERRNDAIYNRDLVAGKMTTAQNTEARRLASEWKPRPER